MRTRLRTRNLLTIAVVMLATLGFSPLTSTTARAADAPAFSRQETLTRTHLDSGTENVVDTRHFSVSVAATQNLRDRQAIEVSWTGAHPTGGLVTDHNSAAAALQEYPVVLMQCRGVDSTSVDPAKRVTPQTCWTQTPAERFQYSQSGSIFPSYRMDRYAATPDRASVVNQPNPLPAGCSAVPAAHWVPFTALDGTVYPGGLLGCAGLAPEAANAADSLQPGNTTYGVSNQQGEGAAKFIIQTDETNASMGCSKTVACTLEIIPIMGVSCDAAGVAPGADMGMPPANRPDPSVVSLIASQCELNGHFAPGQLNGGGELPDLPVSGQLWWSASNWRNRITVPLTFAQSASACAIVTNQASVYLYGSESLLQATQQWAPRFCLDPKLFTIRHVQTSEPQAKNLLAIKNIEAAIQGVPPSTPFPEPVAQAPVAMTGWAIAATVDDKNGAPIQVRLNARLIAKLMTESYPSCSTCLDFTSKQARYSGFAALSDNPIDISRDPEFLALNPNVPPALGHEGASTLEFMSSDSDVMSALTAFLNADPEARSWLDGNADPWGMVINPAYRKIQLPVSNWPLLDTNLPQLSNGANICITNNPVPWLPLISSPVSNPATIALHMQFDIANSQVVCKDNDSPQRKLVAVGREAAGNRYLFGLVSLGDAQRYQLNTALLQTQRDGQSTDVFTSPLGRTFVGPTAAALANAARLLHPDDTIGSWTMPYDAFSQRIAGKNAYPGTMLLSLDVPTRGLLKPQAARYSQLLRFVAGQGQSPGLGVGDLAPGYLPMTSANGLAAFAAYTDRAATAIAEQCGVQPNPSGAASTGQCPTSSKPARDDTAGPPHSDTGTQAPNGAPSTSPSASPSAGPSTSPLPTPTQTQIVPVSKTLGVGPGPLGVALPVALVLALIALCGLAYNNGVGRR